MFESNKVSFALLIKMDEKISAYRIVDKIGEGAHGIVLKAMKISTGQVVALKKIPLRNLSESRGIPNNILREIKTLQQLSHPNVSSMTKSGV